MQSTIECEPSRFLDEIPAGLVEYHKTAETLDQQSTQNFFDALKKKFST